MTWMTGRLLGVDLETCSSDPMTALPVSFALVAMDDGKVQRVRHGLIDPGCEIPAEATAIHGITTEDARARGGKLVDSVKGIVKVVDESVGLGIPIVGMNVVYDMSVINETHRRIFGWPWIGETWKGRVIDVLVLDRHVDRYRRGSRRLSALCDHYGVKLDHAHTAASDAEAAVQVAIAIGIGYSEVGAATLDDLWLLQRKWHQDWFESYQAYRAQKGEAPLSADEADWPVRGLKRVTV